MKHRNEKSILTKKWNFEIFGIDEVVLNVNLQLSGFFERLWKYKEKRGCMSSNVYNIFLFFYFAVS